MTDGRQRRTARNPLTGAAGEYYVAAELCQRRWAASITPRNTQRTDIIAQHLDQKVTIAVQVKTLALGRHFRLTVKDEEPSPAKDEWYILVDVRGELPVYYVMPRQLVSAYLVVSHRLWLDTPGRGGRQRLENPQRAVRPEEVPSYRDKWNALLKPTDQVPHILPSRLFEHVRSRKIGLARSHPARSLITEASR